MTPAAPAAPLPPAIEPPRDPVADAEKAMAFKARFASNLISAQNNASRPLAEVSSTSESTPGRFASVPQAQATQSAATETSNKHAPEININAAHGQPYAVFEGTTIDIVLVDRLDCEYTGAVKVMVTNPVYSEDRHVPPEAEASTGAVLTKYLDWPRLRPEGEQQ